MKCSRDDCPKDAVAYWPAFDRNVQPAPYCAEHLEEAKRSYVLEGPRLLDMIKPKRELVTV